MLPTFTRTASVATAPTTVRGSRTYTVTPTPTAERVRVAIHVNGSGPTVAPMRAPWGESPVIAAFAIVTTEPFPAEWWRRPRTAPVASDPFVRRVEATVHATEASGQIQIHAADATTITPLRHEPSRAMLGRKAAARKRRGMFARICLVVAGALISFIVIDATSGRAHR